MVEAQKKQKKDAGVVYGRAEQLEPVPLLLPIRPTNQPATIYSTNHHLQNISNSPL